MAGLLREINEQIQSFQAELRDLSDYVWEHPELAFQEHLACREAKGASGTAWLPGDNACI